MKFLPVYLLIVLLAAACTPAATHAPLPTATATLPVVSTQTSVVILPTVQPTTQEINLELLRNFTYTLEFLRRHAGHPDQWQLHGERHCP